MKAELSRVKFIHVVSPLTSADVDTKTQRHVTLSLDGDFVEVRNGIPGHAVPVAFVPLSNVAFFVVKEKAEAKK